jgi:hypothetical protein
MNGRPEMKNKEIPDKLRWIRKACVIIVSLFLALSLIPKTVVFAKKPPTLDEPQEVEEVEADASKSEDGSLNAMGILDAEPTTNVLVDNRARASTNPSVATDSSGNIYVAYEYAYSGFDHDIYCAKSTDGGLTWTNYVVDWALADSRQPAIFVDADDKLWIAYTADDFFRFATSTNGGVNWTVWGIRAWTWYRQVSYPSIGVWGDYAYIAFEYDVHGNGNEYNISYVYSENGGQRWYNLQNIVATNRDERYPSLGISGSRVGVAYEHESNKREHSIRYAYNGGLGNNTWTDGAVAAAETRYPSLSASGDNWIIAFETPNDGNYDIHTRYSTDGGQSWSGTDALAISDAHYPALANQGTDAWVVGFGGTDVAISGSADGGASWDATATLLADPDAAEAGLHWVDVVDWPTTGPSASNHPLVAWVDSRDSQTDYDIYSARLNEDPLATTLRTPADGEETDLTPDFVFSAIDPDSDALSYQIQVDDDFDFGSPLVNKDSSAVTEGFSSSDASFGSPLADAGGFSGDDPYSSGSDVTYTYQDTDPVLDDSTTYYWRVRAKDSFGTWGDWSPVWSFDANNPTVVTLVSFAAEWDGDTVVVEWETALEINTVGFNLWRGASPDGEYQQVNGVLIPAESLGGAEGGFYKIVDTDVTPGRTYYYKLEEIEVGGARNWYGSVSTGAQAPTAVTISSFAVESPVNLALIGWLAAAVIVSTSGMLLNRLRKNRL